MAIRQFAKRFGQESAVAFRGLAQIAGLLGSLRSLVKALQGRALGLQVICRGLCGNSGTEQKDAG